MFEKKNYIYAAIVSALMVLVLFVFHYTFPSMLNSFHVADYNYLHYPLRIAHNFFDQVYQYHREQPAFAARPLTSFLLHTVHRGLSITYANSFILVNFSLLFLCGIALYQLGRAWKATHREAVASIILFFLSFTVLFSFFAPIYSYDEPIQYLCILLALLAYTKKQYVAGAALFFIACVARETSLFLIPAFACLFFERKKGLFHTDHKKYAASLLAASILFIVWLRWYTAHIGIAAASEQYVLTERFSHIAYNFKNMYFGIESVVSMMLALGLPCAFVLRFARHNALRPIDRRIILGALMVSVINIPVIFISARAQEARLFALPLLLVWPMLGGYMLSLVSLYKQRVALYGKQWLQAQQRGALLFHAVMLAAVVVSFSLFIWLVYTPMTSGNFPYGYRAYAQVLLLTVYTMIFLDSYPHPYGPKNS